MKPGSQTKAETRHLARDRPDLTSLPVSFVLPLLGSADQYEPGIDGAGPPKKFITKFNLP